MNEEEMPTYGELYAENFRLKHNERVLSDRINKAIKFIKSYNLPEDLKGMGEAPITLNDLNILLDILRGKDENN